MKATTNYLEYLDEDFINERKRKFSCEQAVHAKILAEEEGYKNYKKIGETVGMSRNSAGRIARGDTYRDC